MLFKCVAQADPSSHVYSRVYCIDTLSTLCHLRNGKIAQQCVSQKASLLVVQCGYNKMVITCLWFIPLWLQEEMLPAPPYLLPPPLPGLTQGTYFDNPLHVLHLTPNLQAVALLGGGKLRDAFCARDGGRIGFEAVAIWSGHCRSVLTLLLAKLRVDILFPICLSEEHGSFFGSASGLMWLRRSEKTRGKQKGMEKITKRNRSFSLMEWTHSSFGIRVFL